MYEDALTAVSILLRPKSRGFIELKSADSEDHPIIVPNYFHDPRDLETLVRFNQLNVLQLF